MGQFCVDCDTSINIDMVRGRCTRCLCQSCGADFTSTRRDAKFCSNACRQKAYRRTKND